MYGHRRGLAQCNDQWVVSEIQLLKSMIADDALLATMKVEGNIKGFKVKLTDTQLTTLIKVGVSRGEGFEYTV